MLGDNVVAMLFALVLVAAAAAAVFVVGLVIAGAVGVGWLCCR